MCEFSGKLIAWLDGELPPAEASEVERHLEVCQACRIEMDAYRRVSSKLNDYCDEAMASNVTRGVSPWMPAVAAAVAGAALVGLLLAVPHAHIERTAFPGPTVADVSSQAVASSVVRAPVIPTRRVHKRQTAMPVQIRDAKSEPAQNQNAYLLPEEPTVQIAIPADEMFPPGAVPEGMNFVADVSIAADGSAELLRLRPLLAGYERGRTQP